jgi:hypothetical protein
MNIRQFLIITAVFLLACTTALSQEKPTLIDVAQLNLEVTGTKIVKEIKGMMGNKLSAKEGNKLVVVTLKGRTVDSCTISLKPDDFSAVYEKGKEVEILSFGAMAIGGMWAFTEGLQYRMSFPAKKDELVVIEAAVSLPKNVNSFLVRCPTVVKGKAIVKTQE